MDAVVQPSAGHHPEVERKTKPSMGITVEELNVRWKVAVVDLSKKDIIVTNPDHALEGALSIRYVAAPNVPYTRHRELRICTIYVNNVWTLQYLSSKSVDNCYLTVQQRAWSGIFWVPLYVYSDRCPVRCGISGPNVTIISKRGLPQVDFWYHTNRWLDVIPPPCTIPPVATALPRGLAGSSMGPSCGMKRSLFWTSSG